MTNRIDLEAGLVAGLLRHPEWVQKLVGFGPRWIQNKFLNDVAGYCVGAFHNGKAVPVAAIRHKMVQVSAANGPLFDKIAGWDVTIEDFLEDAVDLRANFLSPSDTARDSGKDAPKIAQAGSEGDSGPQGLEATQRAKNRGAPDGPPQDHPAAAADPRPEPPAADENAGDTKGFQRKEGAGQPEDRPPLHNYDAEKALLAALLANEAVYTKVCGVIQAEDFADALHGRIYDAIGRLVSRGIVANPVTLKNLFDQDGALSSIGGAKYLVDLASNVVTVLNADDYAHQVVDLATRRRLLKTCESLKAKLWDFDTDANAMIADAVTRLPGSLGSTGSDIVSKHELRQQIADYVGRPGKFYSTGFPKIDRLFGGGLYAGKLYGLAARKKQGKSSLAGSISHEMNALGTPHGFAALEMSPFELEMRDVGRDLQVNTLRLMMGTRSNAPVDPGRVIETMPNTNNLTWYFKRPRASLADLRGFILQVVSRYKATGIILDYHQLIARDDPAKNEEQHLRDSAQALADLTRQLGIWILMCLQLNQDGNSRGGEGIKLACDAYVTLHRAKGQSGAWLELEETRYTGYGTVGTETVPGLEMDPHGPHFREAGATETEDEQLDLSGLKI